MDQCSAQRAHYRKESASAKAIKKIKYATKQLNCRGYKNFPEYGTQHVCNRKRKKLLI